MCVCVCVCVCKRERQTDRQTDRDSTLKPVFNQKNIFSIRCTKLQSDIFTHNSTFHVVTLQVTNYSTRDIHILTYLEIVSFSLYKKKTA